MKELKLCDYGESEYILRDNNVYVRVRENPGTERLIYGQVPIKRGYREFMNSNLARAMEENSFFD